MKNKSKKRNIYTVVILLLMLMASLFYNWSQSNKLDAYYLDRFKSIKSRMIYQSSVDTKKELNDYHDLTEFCMHLDGYNGLEIQNIKSRAFLEAAQESPK